MGPSPLSFMPPSGCLIVDRHYRNQDCTVAPLLPWFPHPSRTGVVARAHVYVISGPLVPGTLLLTLALQYQVCNAGPLVNHRWGCVNIGCSCGYQGAGGCVLVPCSLYRWRRCDVVSPHLPWSRCTLREEVRWWMWRAYDPPCVDCGPTRRALVVVRWAGSVYWRLGQPVVREGVSTLAGTLACIVGCVCPPVLVGVAVLPGDVDDVVVAKDLLEWLD